MSATLLNEYGMVRYGTEGIGASAPPTPVRSGHGNYRNPRRKKLEVLWREVTDHLGQTDFTEI